MAWRDGHALKLHPARGVAELRPRCGPCATQTASIKRLSQEAQPARHKRGSAKEAQPARHKIGGCAKNGASFDWGRKRDGPILAGGGRRRDGSNSVRHRICATGKKKAQFTSACDLRLFLIRRRKAVRMAGDARGGTSKGAETGPPDGRALQPGILRRLGDMNARKKRPKEKRPKARYNQPANLWRTGDYSRRQKMANWRPSAIEQESKKARADLALAFYVATSPNPPAIPDYRAVY
jgi:hypothetical protein